jgi:flagellar basal body rod protein FlgG
MVDSIQANASSQEALSARFEATAHNLANANTGGYKRIMCEFISGGAAGTGAATGSDAISVKAVHDFSQGALAETGRSLDLGLQGKGFFVLETPKGQLYTRHGVFTTNGEGQLTDLIGRVVAGDSGPIVIPKNVAVSAIGVGSDGTVSAGKNVLGKVKVVEFEDPQVLTAVGQNAFEGPSNLAQAPKATVVRQGYQEASNVSVVDELVGLITVSRMYEANLKTVQSRDERLKTLLGVAAG